MRAWRVLVASAAVLVATGVSPAAGGVPAPAPSDRSAATACAAEVDALLARMTRSEKVGQMIMVLNAPAFGDFTDTTALIRDHHIGSVVSHAYFGLGPADAAAHNNGLQQAAATTRLGIPILNAADFEAGVGILVAQGTSLPLQLGLGAAHQTRFAADAARVTAAEARALGFQWTLSPLADVLATPLNGEDGTRAFGAQTNRVAGLVATQVETFQSAGLISTAKHFPGMGGSTVNSHFALPRVDYGRDVLDKTHLPPFRAAVGAGVGAVMTGHIVVEAVDPDLPASLSQPVTSGLLRDTLGYDGVVVTDSMTQGGVVGLFEIGEAAVMAVQAGADIVMEIGPTEVPLVAIAAILEAVESGALSESRIDQSARRVLTLKCEFGVLTDPLVDPAAAAEVVGSPDHVAVGNALNREAVTLVQNEGVLPFDGTATATTLVAGVTHPGIDVIPTGPYSHIPQLGAAVERLGTGEVVTWQAASEDPTADEVATAVGAAATADRILVATYSAGSLPEGQARLVEALLATGKPLAVIATGTPYDLSEFPDVPGFVASYALTFLPTYAFSWQALEAAVETVFGERPRGRLPVPIPGMYPVGHRLGDFEGG